MPWKLTVAVLGSAESVAVVYYMGEAMSLKLHWKVVTLTKMQMVWLPAL